MNKLLSQLLVFVFLSFLGIHLKGEVVTFANDEKTTISKSTIDSIQNQVKNELNEEYKFKAILLEHQNKISDRWPAVDRWLAVLGIIVSFFGVFIPIALIIFSNKQFKENKKRLEEIDALKERTETKVEKTINESKNELVRMIERADNYLDIIQKIEIEAKEKHLKIKEIEERLSYPSKEISVAYRLKELRIEDNSPFAHYFYLSQKYTILKKYEEAIEIWDLFLKSFEFDKKGIAQIYGLISNIELKFKHAEDALRFINLSIQLDSNNPFYYPQRGNIYLNLNEPGKAENDFTQAIKLASDNNKAAVLYQRGNIRAKRGKYKQAIEDYSEAIKFDDKLYYCYSGRAFARCKLSIGTTPKYYKQALEDYQKAVKSIFLTHGTQLTIYELAICLNEEVVASSLKPIAIPENDESTITDYLNMLYEIIFQNKTEFDLEAIESKLNDYKFEIEWSFNEAEDMLAEINNKTATRLIHEYEELIKVHNSKFRESKPQ